MSVVHSILLLNLDRIEFLLSVNSNKKTAFNWKSIHSSFPSSIFPLTSQQENFVEIPSHYRQILLKKMSFYGSKNNVDLEAGNGQLYPGMQENPQLRWAFIRKVYSILCVQLLITFGVSLGMFFIPPVREFLRSTNGLYTMIALIVVTFIRK